MILFRINWWLKPTTPRLSTIWLFHYLHWNYLKGKGIINSLKWSLPLKPVLLAQASIKATTDSPATDTYRYPDYNSLLYPHPLRVRICTMPYHHKFAGHSGVTKMYATIQKIYYWTQMATADTSAVQDFLQWTKNQVCLRQKASPLKSFPAFGPLESVTIDILGPAHKSQRGFQYIVMKAELFTKKGSGSSIKAPFLGECRSSIIRTLSLHVWTAKDTPLRQWKTIHI